MPKTEYDQLVQEYISGKPMKEILKSNPWARKNTIYARLNKQKQTTSTPEDNNISESLELQIEEPKPSFGESELFEVSDELFSDNKISKLSNDDLLMSEFGHLLNTSEPQSYNPQSIMEEIAEEKALEATKKEKAKIPPKSWWFKEPKVKTKAEKDEELEEARLKKIYEIRLYLYNFDLDDLHIIKGNKEKFIVDLYSKKESELNKVLHFLKFHVRFNNKQISKSLIENGFFTACKFIEHFSSYLGLQTNGFTESIKSDEEIDRLLKEIAIEWEASKPSFGAKTDLGLKFLTTLAQVDASNRLTNQASTAKDKKLKIIKQRLEKESLKKETQQKYSDL